MKRSSLKYLVAITLALAPVLWSSLGNGETSQEGGWQASIKREKLDSALIKSAEDNAVSFQQSSTIIRDDLSLKTNAELEKYGNSKNEEISPKEIADNPDERVLWRLFNAEKDKQLLEIIGQWQHDFPNWSPPLELLNYLDERQKNKRQQKIRARQLARQRKAQRIQAERQKLMDDKRNELTAAFLDQNPAELILAGNKNRDLFTCREIANLTGLLPMFAFSHEQDELLALFKDTMMAADCQNESSRITILENSQNYLDVSSFESLLTWALPLLPDKDHKTRLEEISYRHQTMSLANAIKDGRDHQYLTDLIYSLEPKITAHKDTPVAISSAWALLPEAPELSLMWFKSAATWSPPSSNHYQEALYGMALAMQKQGKDEELIDLADQHLAEIPKLQSLRDQVVRRRVNILFKEGDYQQALLLSEKYQEPIPDLSALRGRILLAQAWQSHKENNYEASRIYATKALSIDSSSEEAGTLLAWLDYGDGNYRQALEKLEPLHKKQPSRELAETIVNCYRKLNADRGEFIRLGESDPAYLGPLVAEIQGQDLFWRKEFLAAANGLAKHSDYVQNTTYAKTKPAAIKSQDLPSGAASQKTLLTNIDSPWLAGNLIYRNKSGESGTSKLSLLYFPALKANYTHNNLSEFGLYWQKISLTSGRFDPWNTPVGSAGVFQNGNRSLANQQDIDLTAAYTFGFEYQKSGWWHPFFKIGLTPTQAEVDPALTFEAGVKKQIKTGSWELELFSKPVRESILSFSGMKDPYSNLAWGRVLKSGISANLAYSLSSKWGLYGEAEIAGLAGQRVDSNQMVKVSGSLGYKLDLNHFDYFSMGPYAGYTHYDKNRSHFTLGHGGYFSPDLYRSFGLAVDFLTNEGEKYILKGRAGGGYQNIDNDEAELFPDQAGLTGKTILRADSSVLSKYAADHSAGSSFFAELIGSYLIAPHWQISGGLSYQDSRGYQDYSIGIGLRYFFRPRTASWSTDIPPHMFEAIQ